MNAYRRRDFDSQTKRRAAQNDAVIARICDFLDGIGLPRAKEIVLFFKFTTRRFFPPRQAGPSAVKETRESAGRRRLRRQRPRETLRDIRQNGEPEALLNLLQMRNPSVSPGPRKMLRGTVCFVVRSLEHERIFACAGDLRKPLGHHECVSFGFNHAWTGNQTSGWCRRCGRFQSRFRALDAWTFPTYRQTRFIAYAGQRRFATG